MPVSKKRKKDGKPVQRAQAAAEPTPQHEQGHETHPAAPQERRAGKPSNPFVAQQTKRASQRGR
jgi:hypothetical protein